MKIIQAVHINGTDKHKRYWKVPDHLQPIRLRKGDEAAVETKSGPQRVKIVAVVTSNDVKGRFLVGISLFWWVADYN